MIGTKLSRLFQGLVTSAGSPVMAHFVHNQMQFYGSIVFFNVLMFAQSCCNYT